jgi:Cu(I)/Ag(I) efflux system membrane fusion protein
MRQVNFFQILLMGFALSLAGCARQENAQTGTDDAVVKAYLNVKNALYEDDWAKAQIMSKNMIRTLEKFSPRDTTDWQSAAKELSIPLDSIAASKDIARQRMHFEKLSDAIYNHIRKYGLSSGTLYRTFCPMAFDNKGAYWISDKEEIENPYFGSEMPHCGEVKDTLEVQ